MEKSRSFYSWRKLAECSETLNEGAVSEVNKGNCFFCAKDLSEFVGINDVEECDQTEESFSIRNLCHLLKISSSEVLEQTKKCTFMEEGVELFPSFEKQDVTVTLCKACGTLSEGFTKLLLEMEVVQMKINDTLETIREQVSKKYVTFDHNQSVLKVAFANQLRKEISRKCLLVKLGAQATIEVCINGEQKSPPTTTALNSTRKLRPRPGRKSILLTTLEPDLNCKPHCSSQLEDTDYQLESLSNSAIPHKRRRNSNKSELKRSKHLQSKERSYTCNLCDEKFAKSSHLTTHHDKIHLQKTFICPWCNKKCCDRWKYRTHMENCVVVKEEEVCDLDDGDTNEVFNEDFLSEMCSPPVSPGGSDELTAAAFPVSPNPTKDEVKDIIETDSFGKAPQDPLGIDLTIDEFLNLGTDLENQPTSPLEKIIPDHQSFDASNDGNNPVVVNEEITTFDHEKKVHKCNACSGVFVNWDTAYRHYMEMHQQVTTAESKSDLRPFPCDLCDLRFKRSHHLITHKDRTHFLKTFQCKKCNKKCSDRWKYKKHVRECDGVKPPGPTNSQGEEEAATLEPSFPETADTVEQMSNDTDTLNTSSECSSKVLPTDKVNSMVPKLCKYCGKKFVCLSKHISAVHFNVRTYKCKVCHLTFKKSSHLTAHHDKVHLGKIFKCEKCNKKLPDSSAYTRHITKLCPMRIKAENAGMRHICDVCNQELSSEKSLKRHKDQVHNPEKKTEEPSFCNECNIQFKTKAGLKNHMEKTLIHAKKMEFQCEMCARGFMQRNSLDNHQAQVHFVELKIKPFQCNYCEQVLAGKRSLDHHIRVVHTKETLFNCEQCKLGFMYEKGYQKHLEVVHQKLQNYQCAECPRSFSLKHNLKAHMRVHSGEKPYKCNECDKRFSDKPTFNRHMETHGDQVHVCSVCGATYKVWHAFRLHMKKHDLHVSKVRTRFGRTGSSVVIKTSIDEEESQITN